MSNQIMVHAFLLKQNTLYKFYHHKQCTLVSTLMVF